MSPASSPADLEALRVELGRPAGKGSGHDPRGDRGAVGHVLMRARCAALVLAALVGACAEPAVPELTVLAASSLRDACGELAQAFEAEHGARVVSSYAGSSLLATQLSAGAPGDVFLAAGEAPMDQLEQAGLLAPGSRVALLSNSLVVVQPEPLSEGEPRVSRPDDLLDPRLARLSLANPEAVPAGAYARAWLESAGLWDQLSARVIPGVDVRAALALVEAGAAEVGIVYATDAAQSQRVRVAYRVPPQEGPRIVYPLAILRAARAPDLARAFVEHLRSPAARAVFERHGFVVLGAP